MERLKRPLFLLWREIEAGLAEGVEVIGADGRPRLARVAGLEDARMTVDVLEPMREGALLSVTLLCRGEPLSFGLRPGMLGRLFDGAGQPADGGAPVPAAEWRDIAGGSISPAVCDRMNDGIGDARAPQESAGRPRAGCQPVASTVATLAIASPGPWPPALTASG